MKKILRLLLPALFFCFHAIAQGRDTMGTRLQYYLYPYPVSYMHTTVQQQPVEIAYMYVKARSGSGRNVLLFHGKNFPAAYWKSTMDALTSSGYNVIAPDALGFGKSSKPVVQYSFSLLASLAKQLLDTLQVTRVAVVGHSMGGMLASRFALTYPGYVSALVLEDALGLEDWRSKGVPYRGVEEWYGDEMNTTYERILQYHKTSYYPVWKDAYAEWVRVQYGMAKSSGREQYAWVNALTYDMIYNQPVVHEFPNVRVPTLVVVGSEDKTKLARNAPEAVTKRLGHYRELGKQAAKAIPGAKLVIYEGVGHVPHLEIPERYHSDLLDFLRDKK